VREDGNIGRLTKRERWLIPYSLADYDKGGLTWGGGGGNPYIIYRQKHEEEKGRHKCGGRREGRKLRGGKTDFSNSLLKRGGKTPDRPSKLGRRGRT